MEIGGVALLAVLVLVLALVPQIIQRRTAIMESREGDRFSPALHVVRPPQERSCCGRSSLRLISQETYIRHREGVAMSAQQTTARRPSVQTMSARARAHEIAQLRAQRVARRSAEVASGQRRMALAGVLLGLFVVSVLAAVFASVSWLWALVPVAGLAGVLAVSRRAAVSAARADARDRQRLMELKSQPRPIQQASDSAVVGVETVQAEVAEPVVTPAPVQAASEDLRPAQSVTETLKEASATSAIVEEAAAAAPDVSVVAQEKAALVEKAWTPASLPVSRYSQGARVEGRVVHADTDLRGIPRVKASVPARPIAATVDADARTTDEVAASVPLAFDLDEILEARRA